MWFSKPTTTEQAKRTISHCPRCKREAPWGKLGFKWVGKIWDYLPEGARGPYCKFCAPEILHEQLPKIICREIEEKGNNENAG